MNQMEDEADEGLAIQSDLRRMTSAYRFCRSLRSEIAKKGWTVISDEDEEFGARLYTVGLSETYGHPELLISGEESEEQVAVFCAIVSFIQWGLPLPVGQLIDRPFQEPVLIRAIESPRDEQMAEMSEVFARARDARFGLVEVVCPSGNPARLAPSFQSCLWGRVV
jgi:hypothetical protein